MCRLKYNVAPLPNARYAVPIGPRKAQSAERDKRKSNVRISLGTIKGSGDSKPSKEHDVGQVQRQQLLENDNNERGNE